MLNFSPAKMWTVTIPAVLALLLLHANFMEASKEQLRLRRPSFVSRQEERKIMLEVAKQADKYTGELELLGLGPLKFCDIREVSDTEDCDTYLEEVEQFLGTIGLIFETTPEVVTHGPVSLVVPMEAYKDDKTPEERLRTLNYEFQKYKMFLPRISEQQLKC